MNESRSDFDKFKNREDAFSEHLESRIEISRRMLAATPVWGAAGLTLGGRLDQSSADASEQEIDAVLVAADIKGVDTVLGAPPPAMRTGDLAKHTGPALGATMVLAKGCVTPGDGGGGLFYWSTESKTDDGGTVIVPKGEVGTTGPCWRRIHSGPLSVRFFGAQGNNLTSDDRAINRAIQATHANGGAGGDVYMPSGRYKTTGPIIIDLPNIRLRGAGTGTAIAGVGGFHTIAINSTGTAGCRFIEIGGFVLDDTQKAVGRGIEVLNTGDLQIADIIVFQPWEGIHLHNFNHVEIERVALAGPRAPDAFGFWLSGGGSLGAGRSDVIAFRDTTVVGLAFAGVEGCTPGVFCPQGRRHGIIIDGAVNTVSSSKMYLLALQGAGIWFRNFVQSPANPEFASFYGLEIDFPQLEGIRIDVGQRLHFTDLMVHGSHERTNVAVGVGPGSTVNTVSFKGGFSSGAALTGMDIWAREVCVHGMNFLFNAGARRNDVNGPAGLEILHTARQVTITGNTIGDTASSHNFGIKVESGADHYAIVGNIAISNSFGGIRNSPGPAVGLREVVGNVGSVV
jgi:Pectate lyase superfamily protein